MARKSEYRKEKFRPSLVRSTNAAQMLCMGVSWCTDHESGIRLRRTLGENQNLLSFHLWRARKNIYDSCLHARSPWNLGIGVHFRYFFSANEVGRWHIYFKSDISTVSVVFRGVKVTRSFAICTLPDRTPLCAAILDIKSRTFYMSNVSLLNLFRSRKSAEHTPRTSNTPSPFRSDNDHH